MRVIWSARAVREADDIAAYIAKDRPMAAESWLIGAFESAEQLKEFPESGRVVPGGRRSDYRELVYREAYRIVYRIEGSLVRFAISRSGSICASSGSNSAPHCSDSRSASSSYAKRLPNRAQRTIVSNMAS